MIRYFATFPSGFKKQVQEYLLEDLENVKLEEIFDNLVVFSTSFPTISLTQIEYFSNVFQLVNKFGSPNMQSFDKMVDWANSRPNFLEAVWKFSQKKKFNKYRLYFFENSKSISSKKNAENIKEIIHQNTNLKYSSGASDFEIWFIKRIEEISLIGIRLSKKQDYQETLEKGELRPEIAYLLCRMAGISFSDMVLDPFCGNGAIPIACFKSFKFKKFLASDSDTSRITNVFRIRNIKTEKIEIEKRDGFSLDDIKPNSIDKIITDPPWGVSDNIDDLDEKYKKMIFNFNRVLKNNGNIILLSSQHKLVQGAVNENVELEIVQTEKIYVGGQESFIFKILKILRINNPPSRQRRTGAKPACRQTGLWKRK